MELSKEWYHTELANSEYEALTMLRAEVGATFVDVLRDAGVFKDDAAGRAVKISAMK